MKRLLLITLFLSFAMSANAQRHDRNERIKTLKIAFITERLDLSESEAEKFWPVYNNLEDEKEKLRAEAQNFKKDRDIETISDDEARLLIQGFLELEDRKSALHKKYINDLLRVIPAKKVILLKATEDAFNKRLFQQMRERKEQFRNSRP